MQETIERRWQYTLGSTKFSATFYVLFANCVYFDYYYYVCLSIYLTGFANLPPVFTQDMNNLALSESTSVDTIVYTLEGYDPEGGNVTFGLIGSDNFDVDPQTGEVKIVKELDREVIFHIFFHKTNLNRHINIFHPRHIHLHHSSTSN